MKTKLLILLPLMLASMRGIDAVNDMQTTINIILGK